MTSRILTKFLWCMLISLFSFSAVHAEGLDFSKTTLAVDIPAGETVSVIRFPFTNTTTKPLTITRYESECSCMEILTKEKKLDYAPGESGEIQGTFTIGASVGTIEKSIRVWLKGDPADRPSIVLKIKATIPELIQIQPKTLQWIQGKDGGPMTARITMHGANPIKVTGVSCSDPLFSHEVKTIVEGKEYELIVRCKSTSNKSMGVFKIETDSTYPTQRSGQIFGVVR